MAETHYSLILDDKLLKKIEEMADKNHRSTAGEIRLALEEWILDGGQSE